VADENQDALHHKLDYMRKDMGTFLTLALSIGLQLGRRRSASQADSRAPL